MASQLSQSKHPPKNRLFWVSFSFYCKFEGVVALWCNPLTLQPERSAGVGSISCRAPPLERHEKGSQTRLALGAKTATSPSLSPFFFWGGGGDCLTNRSW